MIFFHKSLVFLIGITAILLSALIWRGVVFASTTDGTLSGYAWSDTIGWVNFGNASGNVHITDTVMTGYAWNENTGWINLGATNGGVTNDAEGDLAGKAWSEGVGWINFASVAVSSSGVFSGTATADTGDIIYFGCTQCSITTDWRPASSRSGGSSGGTTSGGPGGGSSSGGSGSSTSGSGGDTTTSTTGGSTSGSDTTTGETTTGDATTGGTTGGSDTSTSTTGDAGGATIGAASTGTDGGGTTTGGADAGTGTTGGSRTGGAAGSSQGSGSGGQAGGGSGGGGGVFIPSVVKAAAGAMVDFITGVQKLQVGLKKVIETPAGSVITKIISTSGVVGGVIATSTAIALSPASLAEIAMLPVRVFALLLGLLGIRKKRLPWGVAYDSVTKQPLDPAYITLKNSLGKDVSSAITDLDGRYGFLVEPGIYRMLANKTNYMFPSQKLAGKDRDQLYDNLYFGQEISVQSVQDAIIKNIPMDPVKFDWNEFAKKDKKLMSFYSKWDAMLRNISNIFFVVGFVVAIVAFFAAPYPYNTIIFVVYLVLLLFRMLGLKPKPYGFVFEKSTQIPLSFAILRIMDPDSSREVSHKVADIYGRYYCLLPAGKYYVNIEKKNDDESYSLVYTSQVIDVSKKGIIKEKFNV